MNAEAGSHLEPKIETFSPHARAARKVRSDAKLERLNGSQRERLRLWLKEKNCTYAAVVARVREEFGLNVGKSAVAAYWQRHVRP